MTTFPFGGQVCFVASFSRRVLSESRSNLDALPSDVAPHPSSTSQQFGGSSRSSLSHNVIQFATVAQTQDAWFAYDPVSCVSEQSGELLLHVGSGTRLL